MVRVLYVSMNSRSILNITCSKTFDITQNKDTGRWLSNTNEIIWFVRGIIWQLFEFSPRPPCNPKNVAWYHSWMFLNSVAELKNDYFQFDVPHMKYGTCYTLKKCSNLVQLWYVIISMMNFSFSTVPKIQHTIRSWSRASEARLAVHVSKSKSKSKKGRVRISTKISPPEYWIS